MLIFYPQATLSFIEVFGNISVAKTNQQRRSSSNREQKKVVTTVKCQIWIETGLKLSSDRSQRSKLYFTSALNESWNLCKRVFDIFAYSLDIFSKAEEEEKTKP